MTIWGDRLVALLSAAGAIYMAYLAWNFPAGGDIFPKFICAAILCVAALMVVRTFSARAVYDGGKFRIFWGDELQPLLTTAAVVAYVLLIFVVGYYTTSFLFLCALSWAVGVRSVKTIAITALVTFPLLYAFFELFLNAQMPRGWLI